MIEDDTHGGVLRLVNLNENFGWKFGTISRCLTLSAPCISES